MECLLCTKRNFILSQLAGVLFVAALFIAGPDVIPSGMILAGIAMCWAIVATGFWCFFRNVRRPD